MKGILDTFRHEYQEDGVAKRVWKIRLFGIPIFTAKLSSTNSAAVKQLTQITQTKILGFTDETSHKN